MKLFNFKNWDCRIVENKKIFFIISLSIILIGLIVFFIFGFNVGIDFSGGTIINVTLGDFFSEEIYDEFVDTITDILKVNGIKVEVVQEITSQTASGVSMRYQNMIKGVEASEDEMFALNASLKNQIEDGVKKLISNTNSTITQETLDKNIQVSMSNVGATSSAELLWKALLSILVAAVLILGYIAIRFELLSGVAAVIALIHDLLIMSALVVIFRIQVNSSFVAALITILGYSINNTIVLFDRVRENDNDHDLMGITPTHLINLSIKETMTRSIHTTITTIITIILLAIFGVSQVKEFALPILFGLLAGSYSSVCIAPPIWAMLKESGKGNNKKDKMKQKYLNAMK